MNKAEILTPFIGDGTDDNAYRAQLGDDHGVGWQDETGIASENLIPNTNLYSVICPTLTDIQLAAIEGDNTYYVVWSEEIVEDGI